MKIVVAPTAFKGTLSALEAADIMEQSARDMYPNADIIRTPIADGGDGFLSAALLYIPAKIRRVVVNDPLGAPIWAEYGILLDGKTAIIESAKACGIALLKPSDYNPFFASTYGVGELLMDAAVMGVEKVILGLGGSATNDGGAGLLQALGFQLLNADGDELPRGGAPLIELDRIIPPEKPFPLKITGACDVINPICGDNGAIAVYGPQKGVSPDDIEILQNALNHYTDILENTFNVQVKETPYTGAAGGMGSSLLSALNAQLTSGINFIFEEANIKEALRDAQLLITGEGKFDRQSFLGKATGEVIKIANALGVPSLVFCGKSELDLESVRQHGVLNILPIEN